MWYGIHQRFWCHIRTSFFTKFVRQGLTQLLFVYTVEVRRALESLECEPSTQTIAYTAKTFLSVASSPAVTGDSVGALHMRCLSFRD